jgi:threonine aldolase
VSGKKVDAQTAMAFLKQAGGDKNKARQLAVAAGYSF